MSINLPSRSLVSQEAQSMIARPDVPRSRFLNQWTRKTTFDGGFLVPFVLDEVLPGDHLSYDVEAYLRTATPLFPVFDNMRVDTFAFFCPMRLLWDNFEKFMGEQADPTSSIAYTIPQLVAPVGGFPANSLIDHLGVPVVGQTHPAEGPFVNLLPTRMYQLLWNQWFRDQNLQDSAAVTFGDGPTAFNATNHGLRRRGKPHDYFTTCLPAPQKFTSPTVPLAGAAPVYGLGVAFPTVGPVGGIQATLETPSSRSVSGLGSYPNQYSSAAEPFYMEATALGVPQVFADLSVATGVTINTLRSAWLVQSMLERDARGGTRYTEIVRSHFGVTSPDARLQRVEYIGGGSSPLVFTPIAQTVPSGAVPLGALGAAGTSSGQHRASYASTEHGYIMWLVNVREELSYQQGLHKMWTRLTRADFYWPSLAGLGEQAVLRKEIYATGVAADDNVVFGYQERFMEYRTRVSDVSGLFRSTTTGTLDAWHLSERFLTPPVLGSTFIQDAPPMSRVLAAGALDNNKQFLGVFSIKRDAVRPVPTYGTPVSLGRF